MIEIPDKHFFRIGDVAKLIGVQPYVLRFWQTKFPMVSPKLCVSSGHRVYTKLDVEAIVIIHRLLYLEKYTIEGAQQKIKGLRESGQFKTFKAETIANKGNSI